MYYSQLSQWGAIFKIAGIHFVNLQYDNCAEELQEAENLFDVPIHNWNDIDRKHDQDELAALMAGLDLVLSAGTAVDQLAGALGRPTWVLTRGTSDVWGLGTGACPWYPSIRVFHCGASEPWEPIIGQLASELRQLARSRSRVEAA
jgi:ADP-heptose:LPS heptosyltransferase